MYWLLKSVLNGIDMSILLHLTTRTTIWVLQRNHNVMSFSPVNIALNRYWSRPNRYEPNEFATYLTLWLGRNKDAIKVELSAPLDKSWNSQLKDLCNIDFDENWMLWCREIGVVDADSPISENIHAITSLYVWLIKYPSFYHCSNAITKIIFSYLCEISQLAILCDVSKRWARLARCNEVFGLATARIQWVWSGLDSDGNTEEDLWERIRHQSGLSVFSLAR